MTRSGQTITLTPIRESDDPLAAFLEAISQTSIPADEIEGWDDDPEDLPPRDVEL